MERRQRPQSCRCQEVPAGIEFQKILESEEAGIVIYRYVPDTNGAGNGESYIVKNTKKQQATSEDFRIAFEQNKVTCPRCAKIIEHAESLVKYIPLIESQDVVSICDHCHRKGEQKRLRSSCCCKQIVNKFLIGRQLEEVKSRKRRTKRWLLEARQKLHNDISRMDKRLIRNHAMDVTPVDHAPFKRVEPTDSPPTGLKVRKSLFLESVHTDSHGFMRRDPSLDNSLKKHFEKHSLNNFYQKKSTREPTLTKLSEEKQWGKNGRKETGPFKVASFLDIPEENVNPNMFIISKSQGGKINETQKRPSLKREKNLAIGQKSRGLPVTSMKDSITKVFNFLFPDDIIRTSSSIRFPSSTELLKNMQDMFKAQAEKEKRIKDDDLERKREREHEKNKIIDAGLLINGENDRDRDKKSNTLTKNTDSSYGFGKEKKTERTSINREASENENVYTDAETNENKDHKKKENKEQARKDKEEHDYIDKKEKRRERQDQIHKNKDKFSDVKDETLISKDAASKGATLKDNRNIKTGQGKHKDLVGKDDKSKRLHMREQLGSSQLTLKDKGETLISKDAASKGATLKDNQNIKTGQGKHKDLVGKDDKSKRLHMREQLGSSQLTLKDKGETLVGKDDKSKRLHMREQLGSSQLILKDKGETLISKDAASKGATLKDNQNIKTGKGKHKDLVGKDDKSKRLLKDKGEKEGKLKYMSGKEDTSPTTLTFQDNQEAKLFNVVIPELPKPLMIVKNPQQPIRKVEIQYTKAREELILKLIKLKQSKGGCREKTKPKESYAKTYPEEIKKETIETYDLYNESDVMLELSELEAISKLEASGKRHDGKGAVIIGTKIIKEKSNRNLKEENEEIQTTAKKKAN